MKRYSSLLFATCTYAILSLASPFATAQIDNTTPEWKTQQNRGQMEDAANQAAVKQVKIPKEVKVSVDVEKPRGVMAIGAQIRLTAEDGSKQYSEVTTSVGYASSSDERVHFGLGASKTAKEIEIRWPSGIRQVLENVEADRVVSIEESATSAAKH